MTETAIFWRSAAVELLMREYHWTPGAAARFADRLETEAAQTAARAVEMRRELAERRARQQVITRQAEQQVKQDEQVTP